LLDMKGAETTKAISRTTATNSVRGFPLLPAVTKISGVRAKREYCFVISAKPAKKPLNLFLL